MVNAIEISYGIDGRWYNGLKYLLSVYFQFLTTGMSQPNTNICTSDNKKNANHDYLRLDSFISSHL